MDHLIVLEGWIGAVIGITIIIGRLQGDAFALGVVSFSGSVSSDLQVIKLVCTVAFSFLKHTFTVILSIANFRIICCNMACTGLSCTGRQFRVF